MDGNHPAEGGVPAESERVDVVVGVDEGRDAIMALKSQKLHKGEEERVNVSLGPRNHGSVKTGHHGEVVLAAGVDDEIAFRVQGGGKASRVLLEMGVQ